MCVRTILKQLMEHKYMQNSLTQALTTLRSWRYLKPPFYHLKRKFLYTKALTHFRYFHVDIIYLYIVVVRSCVPLCCYPPLCNQILCTNSECVCVCVCVCGGGGGGAAVCINTQHLVVSRVSFACMRFLLGGCVILIRITYMFLLHIMQADHRD